MSCGCSFSFSIWHDCVQLVLHNLVPIIVFLIKFRQATLLAAERQLTEQSVLNLCCIPDRRTYRQQTDTEERHGYNLKSHIWGRSGYEEEPKRRHVHTHFQIHTADTHGHTHAHTDTCVRRAKITPQKTWTRPLLRKLVVSLENQTRLQSGNLISPNI